MSILTSTKPDIKMLPGGWEPDVQLKLSEGYGKDYTVSNSSIIVIDNGLTKSDCQQLIALMDTSTNFEKVSVQGNKDATDCGVGSIRTTAWSPKLAEQLNVKFKDIIPDLHANDLTPTDWLAG